MARVLIIAYGNPLRSDDGVGWRAADALRGKFPVAAVEIICLHQPGPELAESVSRCECVVFVDAAAGAGQGGEIQVKELGSAELSEASGFGHAISPDAILRLAEQLYRTRPKAFSVSVTGQDFSHGDSLSPTVSAAVPLLVSRIEEVAQAFLSQGTMRDS
jgi:hydrogenase maturation protease